jgi:CheY-like chemotaxis protein
MQSSPPLAILLAEDNFLNRKIVSLQLKDLPVTLVEAVNGLQALEKAGERRFDLIFMDLRMPLMDGLEATRRIREQERASGLEPAPIYALTAHDSAEDRQASRAAGCTGFLSKPVTRQMIEDILAGRPPRLAAPDQAPALDPDLADLAPAFLKLTRSETQAMRSALEQGDHETLARLGHGLKGAAASYGLAQLSGLGAAIEAGAQANPPSPDLARTIGLIQAQLRALAASCGE